MAKIAEMVEECRQKLKTALSESTTRGDQNAALFDTLADALRIWSLAQKSEKRGKVLGKIYKEHGINEPRPGTNPFYQIVRVCIPGRQPNDYYRYALALRFFHKEGVEPKEVVSKLKENGLTFCSDHGRTPSKRRPKKDSTITLAKTDLAKIKPFASIDAGDVEIHPDQDNLVCLLGRLEDGKDGEQLNLLSSVKITSDMFDQLLKAHAKTNHLVRRKHLAKLRRAKAKT